MTVPNSSNSCFTETSFYFRTRIVEKWVENDTIYNTKLSFFMTTERMKFYVFVENSVVLYVFNVVTCVT